MDCQLDFTYETLKGDGGLDQIACVGSNIIDMLVTLIVALALFFILIGGIKYITARENAEQVTSAKNTITWAVVAIIGAALFWFLIKIILIDLLGVQALDSNGIIQFFFDLNEGV